MVSKRHTNEEHVSGGLQHTVTKHPSDSTLLSPRRSPYLQLDMAGAQLAFSDVVFICDNNLPVYAIGKCASNEKRVIPRLCCPRLLSAAYPEITRYVAGVFAHEPVAAAVAKMDTEPSKLG